MKYTVRVEFDVVSTDAVDVEVDASSIEEARLIARALAADGIAEDFYSIGDFYSTLSDNTDEWEVINA